MTAVTSRQHGERPVQAATMILTAMAMMGLADNFVVRIADTAGLWQFQVIRSTIALSLLGIVAVWRGWRLVPRRWGGTVARSLVQSTALIIYFASLSLMPVAQAVAGLFTAPLFMLLLSAAFFGHMVGPIRIAAVVAGFAGLLLVLRPETGGLGWLSLLPVIAGLTYGIGQLATREWCEGEGAATLLAGFFIAMGFWGVLGIAALSLWPQAVPGGPTGFVLRPWGKMAAEAWIWTFVQATVSPVAVGLIIAAYQRAEASFVAVFEYGLLVFAVLWASILFGTVPDPPALAGIAVIIASGAVIVVLGRDRAAGRPPPVTVQAAASARPSPKRP